ncbi:ribonuclease D [Candidatus Kirkpatrickella diaphorinae]|uniref:Ribonuclease D n=1 Tax=Candidatus Kirkpatrickella diaphorinae TaxID=2984322 RepID=A0ABY6GLN7_9PROT|nr:ribonuclease D [Candidatus Kirkpatrickella diaphorinae]UYH52269.1 ribonuclease D [Candidatus Kirkpatrickella diaphorinae]
MITTNAALEKLCTRLANESFVTIDTEFMREKTYWPELCLVQLAGATDVALIDVCAEGMDLGPLAALLQAKGCIKVFHAARQDLEIFLHLFGALPTPIYDTQVAAMVAGYGDQVGYDSLVQVLTGRSIDKAHRFSDWSLRPLTPAQRDYAAADVTYLREVYEALRDELAAAGRQDWAQAELAILQDPATFQPDPEKQWERLKPRTHNRRMLGLLREVAAWREREAQKLNIPRQRVIRDESLLEIAATRPTDAQALERVRGVTRGFVQSKSGEGLLAAIHEGCALPDEALPRLPKRPDNAQPSAGVVALLRLLLTIQCEAHRVSPRLVANNDDIDRIALGARDVKALSGWRHEVFGAAALAFLSGRQAIYIDGQKIAFTERGDPSSPERHGGQPKSAT